MKNKILLLLTILVSLYSFVVNADQIPAIAVDQVGNVGIGTQTPTSKLDVKGTIKATDAEINGTSIQSLISRVTVLESRFACGSGVLVNTGKECDNGPNNGKVCTPASTCSECFWCSTDCKKIRVWRGSEGRDNRC